MPPEATLSIFQKVKSRFDGLTSRDKGILLFVMVAFALNTMALAWLVVEPTATSADAITNFNKALYWAVTTLTTIGYGDIVPTSNVSRLFTMFVQVSGVAFYGFIITQVSKALLDSNIRKARVNEKMEALRALFVHYEVPVKLQKEVSHYYQHLLENKADEEEEKILSELPSGLQHEVRVYMNLKPLNRVALFKDCSVACLRDVSRSFEEIEFVPGDTVFNKGDDADAMYLIVHGVIQIFSEGDIIAHLHKGHCFGEMALIENASRNAGARSEGYCNLYKLSKVRFDELCSKHKDLRDSLMRIHREREQKKSAIAA